MIEVPWNRCNRSTWGVIPACLDGVLSGFLRITLRLRSNLLSLLLSAAGGSCDDGNDDGNSIVIIITYWCLLEVMINQPRFHFWDRNEIFKRNRSSSSSSRPAVNDIILSNWDLRAVKNRSTPNEFERAHYARTSTRLSAQSSNWNAQRHLERLSAYHYHMK